MMMETDVNFGELTRALIKNQVKQKKLTLSPKGICCIY